MYNYTNLTLTELINKIGSSRYWNLPAMLREALLRLANGVMYEPPYKVYSGLISQSGTDAPTVIIAENTLGGEVVWTRVDGDEYVGTLAGAFEGVTTLFIQNTVYSEGVNQFPVIYKTDENSIGINPDGDNALADASIEVKVYL